MKKIKKTVTIGLLSLCSTVCAAQSMNVLLGNPYTIKSVEEVTGATYQWLENDILIPGATDASYTNTAGKDLVGTYVYVRKAYKEDCGLMSSNAITVYASAYMIPFSAFSPDPGASTGTVWYLTDTRPGGNNNTYKVKKMASGQIWMVQDLKFGTCPNSTESWYDDNSADATTHEPTVFAGYVGHCRSSTYPNAGFMYTWAAAMQDATAYFGSNAVIGCSTVIGTSACQGICPDGWHLPSSSGYDNSEITRPQMAEYEVIAGGYALPDGALSSAQAQAFLWSGSYVNPQNAQAWSGGPGLPTERTTRAKNVGAPVRCVMN
jgi:uncharacterized protein (TIGR02145 family)